MGMFRSDLGDPEEQLAVLALWTDREVVVYLVGEADAATLTNLYGRLRDIAAGRPTQVVMDLAGLDFMDVGSGRAVAQFSETLARRSCAVSVRSAKPVVDVVLALFGLAE
jgi:anti-anti-sigma factor